VQVRRGPDDGTLYTLEGSAGRYTQTEITDHHNPADWFPDSHPPMPDIVAHGSEATEVWACVGCHLPNGAGHPDSGNLAGLPVEYLIRTMNDFRDGSRQNAMLDSPGIMVRFAAVMTDEQIRAAAEYYASLPPVKFTEVIETETVPETFVGAGNLRQPVEGGGMEPLGQRIIELPVDAQRTVLRDPRASFIAYVPPGSVAKGEEIVTTGGGKTVACGFCHGPELKGAGDVPGLAGRFPIYLVRQMFSFQEGTRKGPMASSMQGVAASLSEDDILNIAAYIGSLDP
jgi:cytochrome c553